MKISFFISIISICFSTLVLAQGLKIGTKAPDFKIDLASGKSFQLYDELKKAPQVLVFYRGGWCPYCNLQLKSLNNSVAPKLKKKGVEMLAISVDKIDEGIKTSSTLDFKIASDAEAKVIEQYNIVKQTDEKLRNKYKDYGIDLEKASGKKHFKIAIPAVFVIDQKGIIKFQYVNEDYKVRAQTQDILDAVSKL